MNDPLFANICSRKMIIPSAQCRNTHVHEVTVTAAVSRTPKMIYPSIKCTNTKCWQYISHANVYS